MSNRLSFSQISRYSTCPRSYKHYYIDRIREKTQSAFLSFGSAIDSALNAVLEDLKKNGSVTCEYKANFDYTWNRVKIHDVDYEAQECTLIGYSKSDFQEEILSDGDIQLLDEKLLLLIPDKKVTSWKELKEELEHKKSIRNVVPFPENEHRFLNLMNWVSMRQKAHLMLDAYVRDIVPEITQVIAVQKKVELKSDSDDTVIGYIDAIVKLKGHDEPIVLDNKTAAMPYDSEDVKFSHQLALYCYTLDIKKAAYAVMLKNIVLNRVKVCSVCEHKPEAGNRAKTCDNTIEGKRCGREWIETFKPSASTQLFIDDVPEETQDLIVNNVADVNEAIHAKIYPQNLNSCHMQYGSKCPYFDKCWKGKDDNLIVVEEKPR